MRNMCRRWALLALVVVAAVVVGACGDEVDFLYGRANDGTGKKAPEPICYPAPAAQAKPGAQTPAPVCFHY